MRQNSGEFIKFTREDGTDCFSGTLKYETEKTIKAPDWKPHKDCGNGVHFGGLEEGLRSLFRLTQENNTPYPGAAFKVSPVGKKVRLCSGKYKSEALEVKEQLDFQVLLMEASKSKDRDVRRAIALNPNAPEHLRKRLNALIAFISNRWTNAHSLKDFRQTLASKSKEMRLTFEHERDGYDETRYFQVKKIEKKVGIKSMYLIYGTLTMDANRPGQDGGDDPYPHEVVIEFDVKTKKGDILSVAN